MGYWLSLGALGRGLSFCLRFELYILIFKISLEQTLLDCIVLDLLAKVFGFLTKSSW